MTSFDEQAKDWDKDPMKIERAEKLAVEIRKHIQPKANMTALDFGCATGLLSFFLKDDFQSITLADMSAEMIKVLKTKIKSAQLNHFKSLTLHEKSELPLNTFDVIYTSMTLHHIPLLSPIFEQFHNSLTDNGLLCIADLVKEDGSFHHHDPSFDGHNGFTKEHIEKLLIEKGFRILQYRLFYTISKNEREYPLFLLFAQKIK
jgi:2-polyprenyl-3-methyl-5-hydroxy-6-metoxy-1,4-benzoquinol methylase